MQASESNVVVCSMGALQGAVRTPFIFTLYTPDFTHKTANCHLQKFCDASDSVGLKMRMTRSTDKGFVHLIPAKPPPDQWWTCAGADTVLLHQWTSRERTLRWWNLTSTWVFTWIIKWTGLTIWMHYISKVRADCFWHLFLLCGGTIHLLRCSLQGQQHLNSWQEET